VKKKKKVREKGFVTARIPSWKKKKVYEKGFVIAWIPSWRKRPETTTSCDLKNPIHEGIPTEKRPETTTSCGLKSHPRRFHECKGFKTCLGQRFQNMFTQWPCCSKNFSVFWNLFKFSGLKKTLDSFHELLVFNLDTTYPNLHVGFVCTILDF
jgi:hypothetical protein